MLCHKHVRTTSKTVGKNSRIVFFSIHIFIFKVILLSYFPLDASIHDGVQPLIAIYMPVCFYTAILLLGVQKLNLKVIYTT